MIPTFEHRLENATPPFRCPPFATYVPHRTPTWLPHDNHAQAKAVFLHAHGELWKYDGCWSRILVVHSPFLESGEER